MTEVCPSGAISGRANLRGDVLEEALGITDYYKTSAGVNNLRR
jgi:hypothetical protein